MESYEESSTSGNLLNRVSSPRADAEVTEDVGTEGVEDVETKDVRGAKTEVLGDVEAEDAGGLGNEIFGGAETDAAEDVGTVCRPQRAGDTLALRALMTTSACCA